MYLPQLLQRVQQRERLVALTCYDAGFARLLVDNDVDILLVGDSLGMVIQGHDTTLPVRMAHMRYHTEAVARGAAGRAFILTDLPFGSYQASPRKAFASAARLLAAGANMVKLEGGAIMVESVAYLTARGVPVCAHLGLLPQSVNQTGYRSQGRDPAVAARLVRDAAALQAAGASLLVLESIPAILAKEITDGLDIPTIGIGAGPHCAGQVLVLQDLLGMTAKPPRFARDFMAGAGGIGEALRRYVQAVRQGQFPGPEHSF
ncbi:MAG TPA: 3-methyl-2-oxobutanoate hydroxymethyltransferase [Thiobacillaceae bacterium]|nr:3-methyl-2-oxobutanoate hydroxymethyltransferase [Thiobacillaceae bacterium]HNU64428.1 3-methyl-2-oxobutanoate hydroxymethyltransferase [Thiobacillaceae bacterium]